MYVNLLGRRLSDDEHLLLMHAERVICRLTFYLSCLGSGIAIFTHLVYMFYIAQLQHPLRRGVGASI